MSKKMLLGVLVWACCLAGWVQAGDITSNLEAYWKFNEGEGQLAFDSSGNGKTATMGLSEAVEEADPEWFVPDWGGHALSFDGSDFFTTVPLFDVGTGEITVTWFVQQTDPTGWQYVLANKGDFFDNFFRVGFNQHDGRVRIYTEQDNNERVAVVTDKSYTGEWLWGCITRKGDVGTLYIDGELQQTLPTMPGDLGNGNRSWMIGANGDPGSTERFRGFLDEIRVYSRALTQDDVDTLWEGFKGSYDFASVISPSNGQEDVSPMEVPLTWGPGEGASSHDVYVGSTFEEVENATTADGAIFRGNQTDTRLVLENLPLGTTTYWRVDERQTGVDDAFKGQVWSFTTEPVALELPASAISLTASSSDEGADPVNLINGAGLNDDGLHDVNGVNMWSTTVTDGTSPQIQAEFDIAYKLQQMRVWNHNSEVEFILGFGIKDALIEYSLDGQTWTELGTVSLGQATSQADYAGEAVPLDIVAKYVRITAQSNFGGGDIYGLSELRFDVIPTTARELAPEDGAVLDGLEVTLGWRNSRQAVEHEVYLDVSANLASVEASDAASLATTMAAQGSYDSYSAMGLNLDETYVWKVVEVNPAETPAAHASQIQSFSTPVYLVVDDMGTYTDAEPHRIWETWLDGTEFGTNDADNGSIVGADPASSDFGTANVGRGPSLPIWIDNSAASKSEAVRTFDPAEDWTRSGITTLSLFVQAGDDNTGGDLYVSVNGNKVPLVDSSTYPAGYNPGWVQYVVDLTAMDTSSVASLAVGVEGANASGVIYVDDIRLYANAPAVQRLTLVGSVIEAESGTLTGDYVIMDRPDASGGQYIIVPNDGGGNSTGAPSEADRAIYTIDIPADGDYVLAFRGLQEVSGNSDDSLWVYIPGSIVNDTSLHSSGWARYNNIFDGPQDSINWDLVIDEFGSDTIPLVFTLTAGSHELHIANREDGTGLDAIAVFAVN